MTRVEEIRRVASEWEFDKRIPAPRAARLLRELLRRVDELERGIGQMRLIAGLPLPPEVAAKVAEADRLRKLFDDACGACGCLVAGGPTACARCAEAGT